jgi:16S rRNA (guanine966-N2)-methyltransferase
MVRKFPVESAGSFANSNSNDKARNACAARFDGPIYPLATNTLNMRISGGTARGITLAVPRGDLVRPATDGMRQSVFSSLGERVVGAHFLDLFAGSGAYGLEAMSRGAAGGVFVEKNIKAAACLEKNIAAVCKSIGCDASSLKVLRMDAAQVPTAGNEVPDLVFVDPPYDLIISIAADLFSRLGKMPDSRIARLVVFEMPGELALSPPGWTCVKQLGKGARQPTVAFFRQTR